ncbi:MAG: MlaD family protein [Pseudomonadota bacterium]
MARLSPEAKVGIFVFIGLMILAYMSMRVGKYEFGKKGYELHVYFDSAAGLTKDAAVQIAGVEVGTVGAITLDKGKANVTLLIKHGIEIGKDAEAAIRTRGMLGDKYVELILGAQKEPVLKDGDQISRTTSAADIDRLLNQLSEIGEDVKKVSHSLAGAVGGEKGKRSLQIIVDNLRELTETLSRTVKDNNEKVNEMITNLTQFSKDLREVSSTNREYLNEIVANVRETSIDLEEVIAKVNKGKGTIGKLVNEDETVERLNDSLGSLKEISNKINNGQGTIGKLVNEDDTVEKLNETLTSINDYLQKQDTFRTYVDYRGEYLFDSEEVKSYLSLKIQPKEDKYYLVQIVDDPAGRTTTTTTRTTVNGGPTTTRVKEKTEEDGLKFSALIAKRYYDLTLRGGIIESTGGVGLDYHFFKDQLMFSFDAFDFDSEKDPHLKFKAEFSPIRHLYITAGFDDFVSDEGNESVFLGGGISFSDEDLKTILSNVQVSPSQ